MTTPDDVIKKIDTRLRNTWPETVLAEILGGTESVAPRWPYAVRLGKIDSAALADDFGAHVRSVHMWRDWSRAHHLQVKEKRCIVSGTRQQAITHIVVPDIDTAAAVIGEHRVEYLRIARRRTDVLCQRFPDVVEPGSSATSQILKAATRIDDFDFDILLRVVDWFRCTPEQERAGLTPRQIPLEGIHAKWLERHQALVCALIRKETLALAPAHPSRVDLTYLDPGHLASGGRRHDSYTVGDAVHLPYPPAVVIISENKDTAVGFPQVPGGVAVQGNGCGGGAVAATPWIREAPLVAYWPD